MGKADTHAALEQAILHQDYAKVPDALLVTLLRGYRCSKDSTLRSRCEKIEKILEERGVDLDTFSGATGFGTRTD